MKSSIARLVTTVVALAIAGAILSRLVAPAWAAARAKEPALRLESTATAAGQGVTLALLGGFRALVADGMWIRLNALWERRDLAGTDSLAHAVTAVDPRPVYFWLNGARIIAHDVSTWRIMNGGGYDAVPPEIQQQIDREQGQRALEQLDAALRYHPQSAEIWIERATIELNRLHDPAAAAESYRRAWEQPRGPYYAARLHAEMLRRAGKNGEALAWLKKLHPTLPRDDEAAGRDIVLRRIRELERELGVATAQTYRPPD